MKYRVKAAFIAVHRRSDGTSEFIQLEPGTIFTVRGGVRSGMVNIMHQRRMAARTVRIVFRTMGPPPRAEKPFRAALTGLMVLSGHRTCALFPVACLNRTIGLIGYAQKNLGGTLKNCCIPDRQGGSGFRGSG